MNIDKEAQGVRRYGWTKDGAPELGWYSGQVTAPAELRVDVFPRSFWKQDTTAMFDIQIVKLDTRSYLCITL